MSSCQLIECEHLVHVHACEQDFLSVDIHVQYWIRKLLQHSRQWNKNKKNVLIRLFWSMFMYMGAPFS